MTGRSISKGEDASGAYVLSHPVRMQIVALLREKKKAYPAQIARALEFSERLITFHLSMLSSGDFVESEYALANPPNPPRVVRYYSLTSKVDKAVDEFVRKIR